MLIEGEKKISYKKLEVWQLARELVINIHQMTLHDLPKMKCLKKQAKFAVQLNP